MTISNCTSCGGLYPDHSLGCPFGDKPQGAGGNPLPLLVAPFVVLAIPFIVVVFPVASVIAILAAMAVYAGASELIHGPAAFWLTLFIALIPFLAALNAEHWTERFRGYRIARHVLRVLGVPWLGAQYLIYLPGLMGPSRRATRSSSHGRARR